MYTCKIQQIKLASFLRYLLMWVKRYVAVSYNLALETFRYNSWIPNFQQSSVLDSQCRTELDECDSSPCLNNGECEDLINAYACNCQPGYTSVNCEDNIDECLSNPCQNNGNCTDAVNRYYFH